jgi:hypothetical protein
MPLPFVTHNIWSYNKKMHTISPTFLNFEAWEPEILVLLARRLNLHQLSSIIEVGVWKKWTLSHESCAL